MVLERQERELLYMLVDQENSNILSLRSESLESRLYSRIIGLIVDNKEILLRIRWCSDMLNAGQHPSPPRNDAEGTSILQYLPTAVPLLSPAGG